MLLCSLRCVQKAYAAQLFYQHSPEDIVLWVDVNSVYFAPRQTTPFEFFVQKRKAHNDAARPAAAAAPHREERWIKERLCVAYIRVFGRTQWPLKVHNIINSGEPGRILNMGTVWVLQHARECVYASSMRVLYFFISFSLSLWFLCVCSHTIEPMIKG